MKIKKNKLKMLDFELKLKIPKNFLKIPEI